MSRLFILGNAGLDIGFDLPGLPQPGETLVDRAAGRAPGGKGLNQAVVAGRAIEPMVAAAQAAAALTVTRPGAFPSLPTASELRPLVA